MEKNENEREKKVIKKEKWNKQDVLSLSFSLSFLCLCVCSSLYIRGVEMHSK